MRPQDARHSRHRCRRGISLYEVFATSALLAVVMVMVGPMVKRLVAHKHSIDRQQWAQAELNNILEDLSGRPFQEITAETVAKIDLSEPARERLPEGELTLTVADVAADENHPAARKVSAAIRWPLESGGNQSASLTTWVYPEAR